jgi:hypothetical protein
MAQDGTQAEFETIRIHDMQIPYMHTTAECHFSILLQNMGAANSSHNNDFVGIHSS